MKRRALEEAGKEWKEKRDNNREKRGDEMDKVRNEGEKVNDV